MKTSPNKWARRFEAQGSLADKRIGRPSFPGGRGLTSGIKSSKNAGMPVPPRGTPIAQNFSEKYSLQKVIARYSHLAGGLTATGLQAFVYTPSDRLTLTLQVFFENDRIVNVDPSLANIPTWKLDSMAVNAKSGRETFLSVLQATSNLPDDFITTVPPQLIRVTINSLANNQFNGSYADANDDLNLILQAHWEPNVQTIKRDELDRLYDRCRLAYGQPTIILNNPIP